jgi:hypothetical protein
LNSHAAALLTKEWGRQVDPDAITRLDRFHFIAQVTDRGRLSRPFGLEGVMVEDVVAAPATGGELSEGPVRRSEAAAVLGHLETLDERILAALAKKRKQTRHEEGRRRSAGPERDRSGDRRPSFTVPKEEA